MDRPTTDFVLPFSQVKIVFYTYLTIGQDRQIKKKSFDAVSYDPGVAQKGEDGYEKILAGFKVEMENMAFHFLIKEAFLPDGTKIDDPVSYIENLSSNDSEALFERVNQITNDAQQTPAVKKNSVS